MKTPPSRIRAESPFAVPPRVRLLSDSDHISDAVALAEALDECGAEADVRFADDTAEHDDVHPDAYVVDRAEPRIAKPKGSVLVGILDHHDRSERRRLKSAGFDMLLERPVEPRVLMQKIGECLLRRRG